MIRSGETIILSKSDKDPAGCLKSFVSDAIEIYVKVTGLIDLSNEVKRIEKRQAWLTTQLDNLKKKMNMAGYMDKVPEKVRNENTEKAATYQKEFDANKEAIERLSKVMG